MARKHRMPIQVQRDIRAVIQERIIKYLYTLSEKSHQRIVDTFCHRQMEASNGQAFFIRGYTTYSHSKLSQDDVNNVHPLTDELIESFDEYLTFRKQQTFRDVYIKNTVANALNVTESISDVLELLPTAILNAFSPDVLKTIRQHEPTVTKAGIDKFFTDNEKGINLIREQLLTNMLEG